MSFVIGTAGHVDHGKSTLVRALTGIDPDRLREEKERGLTIDLGFAWLTLPSGRDVSIVDVPGHERFIKNMLAGAGGVDLALLVVAADEGPMPQTREHLAILELLDVPSALVVLTKTDLVEPEYAALVEAELADVLHGTRFAGAPSVHTSAATGEGLPELLAAIDAALDRTRPKRDLGRPRLPIDRAFTVQGFGTVVTGTLVDGALEVGQEVELQPGRLRARIRGLQRHKSKTQRLEPGTRAAVNLSGVHVEEVSRGTVLALPGTLSPVRVLDVRLRAPAILSHPLQHDAGVTLLCATAESEAKLRLLDRDELLPGEEAWAQVVLEQPVAVAPGDHAIIRTPNETAAGGRIVAVNSRRHRRHHPPTLAALERQLAGSPADRLFDLLAGGPLAGEEISHRLGLEAADAAAAVQELNAAGRASERSGVLFATPWLDAAAGRAAAAARDFLAANPLRSGAPREHVRTSANLDAAHFEVVVEHAVARGLLEDRGPALAPPGYAVVLSPAQQEEADRFLAALREGGSSPPTDHLPRPDLLAYLAELGSVEVMGSGVVFDRAVFDDMRDRVIAHIEQRGSVSLAEVRDLFGTSRKYAQAFLEHLDALKLTRRVGDTRVLR
ncbi:MAG: selenocysteine-specific translation elongation factor [Hyphomicrobiales bacterium]